MVTLTRHDQRLLSAALMGMLAVLHSPGKAAELMAWLGEGSNSQMGFAGAVALLSTAEPDLQPDDMVKPNSDTFKSNSERLQWLGKELLREDAEEMGLDTKERPWQDL